MFLYNGGFMKFHKIQNFLISTVCIISFIFSSCTTHKKVVTDDFATESATTDAAANSNDDLSLDDAKPEDVTAGDDLTLDDTPAVADAQKAQQNNSDSLDAQNLENELQAATDSSKVASPPPVVAVESQPLVPAVAQPLVAEPVAPIVPAPEVQADKPVVQAPPPAVVEPAKPVVTKVTDVQFKPNDSGGALMIQSTQPLEYTSRLNAATNQIVIEVQNVVVPAKFKRPLNTKDMASTIGHIDIYQKANSNTARFVIQLRANSEQPLIQPEGNSLMIIGALTKSTTSNVVSAISKAKASDKSSPKNDTSENSDVNTDLAALNGLMNTIDMDEYLANNTKFYGKKISIEASDMSTREVLKFISEESGVNMIFDEAMSGNISLKLRKVPWDQAFVLILKSKGLGYRRQGSVLRIASAETLYKEETAAIALRDLKTAVEPMIVKNFLINYADMTDLESKLKDYISTDVKDARAKGRITVDKRTNMLIVTETATKLKQIEAIIKALDTQPQQVVIEARVIEASQTFSKSIGASIGLNRGVAFNAPRVSTSIGQPWADPSPISISPASTYSAPQFNSGAAGTSLWFGKLGALGDLDLSLRLDESEDKIKILSSPRVTVVSNTQATINQSFKLSIGTELSSGNGATIAIAKFADVGVNLKVTPQISNLGTVRMTLDVSRTGVQPGGTTNSRDMKTEVIVKSGETSVIGGVFQADSSQSKNGIPGLKDIPILGTLFRGENQNTSKTELMVFVTPKILPPVVPVLTNLSAVESKPADAPAATEVK